MTTELTPMQTELLRRSDAIMESIGNVVGTAVDFSKEQIPDIAFQYVAFERAYSSFYIITGVLLYVLCAYSLLSAIKNWGMWSEDHRVVFLMGNSVLGFIGTMFVFINLKTFLLVWFAPKVFLLQSLTSLIKG
jgi:hypothetical protein